MGVRSNMRLKSVLTGVALAVGGSAWAQPAQPTVKLEGTGAHRAAQDAMTLKPFDLSAMLAGLSNWSNAETPPTAESLKGKVVLLVTFAGWYKPSHLAMTAAQNLHAKHASAGLVVIGVHHPKNSASAAAAMAPLKLAFPFAADDASVARNTLKPDQDPDVFLIDRAGNMRYADVDGSSVAAAVEALLKETAEDAAAVPGKIAEAAKLAAKEKGKTRDVGVELRPPRLKVEFEDPEEDAYRKAKWPSAGVTGFLSKREFDQLREKITVTPPTFEFPDETWMNGGKPDLKGRVVVAYLFDPKLSWSLNVLREMNMIADTYWDDCVVIGMAHNFGENFVNASEEETQKLTERNREAMAEVLGKGTIINHPVLVSPIRGEVFRDIPVLGRSLNNAGVGFILSTDSKVRYFENPNERDKFRTQLQRIIAADPGVKARRAAEDELKKKKAK